MSHFSVEISGAKTIQLTKQVDTVEVFFDTPDDNVTGKSADILAHMKVTGYIDAHDSNPYIDLFNWAKDFTSEGQYRKVKVAIGDSADSTCRSYEFERMFVVDYKEEYKTGGNGNQLGEFTLLMNQEANNLPKAETFDK